MPVLNLHMLKICQCCYVNCLSSETSETSERLQVKWLDGKIGWKSGWNTWKDAREESGEDKTWNKWNDASERKPSKKRQMPKRQKSVFAHVWKLKSAALRHHFFASHISLQHCKNQYIYIYLMHAYIFQALQVKSQSLSTDILGLRLAKPNHLFNFKKHMLTPFPFIFLAETCF